MGILADCAKAEQALRGAKRATCKVRGICAPRNKGNAALARVVAVVGLPLNASHPFPSTVKG